MLARLLIIAGLTEFCFYMFLGCRLATGLSVSVLYCLPFAAMMGLLVRASICGLLFSVAHINRAIPPENFRLGVRGWLWLLATEYLALLALYTFLHPLERLFRNRGPETGGNPVKPPILLVHGFFCNSGFWWGIRRFLRRLGYSDVHTINLEPIFGGIPCFAEQVQQRVNEILGESGASRVILLCHSMGGLVARSYVQRLDGAQRVAKIITLGSPHQGTAHARLSFGTNNRQMRRMNSWLAALNAEAPEPVPVVSVFSYHDELVAPQDSAVLSCAENVALAGVGHLAMAFDARVREKIRAALSDLPQEGSQE